MTSVVEFFSVWRTVVVRDREIIDGIVQPAHRGPSQELSQALDEWPGSHYWAEEDASGRIVLVRPLTPPRKERWWLHVLLFSVSFVTVWMAGALLAGAPVGPIPLLSSLPFVARALVDWISHLNAAYGLDFAVGLMGILLAHELGHYFAARRYSIDASPPYFLPAPPWIVFVGTLGAFIRLRSPVVDRRQLLDVGAAGPWVGFMVAAVFLAVGLQRSEIVSEVGAQPILIDLGSIRLWLGDSLVTWGARSWILGDGTVQLHPLAQAGWFGILVTMLNLLPMGQLDGGHVLYAMFRQRQQLIGQLFLVGLLVMGRWFVWWWVWAGFVLILGGGRVRHPSVLDSYRPLPRSRRLLAWATVALLLGTFTPVPFVFEW
ncbi:MAG: site-2 protease family protein [Gemmatimonadota bacterium]|nr:MAG: site-2 protease family protein [Gemmatimonadota bacterium]